MRQEAIQRQADEAVAIVARMREAVDAGRPADRSLAMLFRENRQYGSRDRRFFSAAVFAYFRWKGWVDRISDFPSALAAACQLDGETAHPALNCWATWADAPDASASLQERAEALARHQNWSDVPPVSALVPEWTGAELLDDGTPRSLERFVDSIQRRPPLWLRCRAGQRDAVQAALVAAGHAVHIDERMPDALRIDGAPASSLLDPLLHHRAEIQDIASQAVGTICSAQPGESWWDVCAGGGGKSLHLLEQLRNSGRLLCTDIRESALNETRRRARSAGYTNLHVHAIPSDPTAWNIDGSFDGILLDAPCSGLGTWGRAPDARWRTSRESIATQHDRQCSLLHRALAHLKPGGRLIYAVCSLTRVETEAVIDTVLHAHPGVHIQPTTHPLSGTTTPACLIHPSAGPGTGMWSCSLRKKIIQYRTICR
ncbi:MAG TPA: RsmB/NOP family class I SAM-dependent RNA methyltransferase [Kiritimatiellia bacterium]|nr:RsmB/NOP family class I SAM-dependent RNA methyltransferase [Kiritimatiellia bacterium]